MRAVALATLAAFVLVAFVPAAAAGDLGFPEKFSLAENREEALKELIPGTKEYYYYHCLHLQHEGDFDDVEAMLKLWIKRYGHTSRVEEIRNRRAVYLLAAWPPRPGKNFPRGNWQKL